MSIADWILLGAIGSYTAWLLLRPKKKKCSGCCAQCDGICKK